MLARQLELLYNAFLGGQVDTALIAEQIKMETEISKKYSNFRVTIKDKKLSDNEVEDILRNSVNSHGASVSMGRIKNDRTCCSRMISLNL